MSIESYKTIQSIANDEELHEQLRHLDSDGTYLVIITNPLMGGDSLQSHEWDVLCGLECISQRFDLWFRMMDMGSFAKYAMTFDDNANFHVVMPRYGFLESDIRLHDVSSIIYESNFDNKSYMEPDLGDPLLNYRYNSWEFWKKAYWAKDLSYAGLGPKTWFNVGWANVPDTEHGWVVRGTLKSSGDWANRMFADTREKLADVMSRVYDDRFVSQHGLMIREYLPLMTMKEAFGPEWEDGECVEYRVHLYQGRFVQATLYHEAAKDWPVPVQVQEFASKCYDVVKYDGWLVVDVAQLSDGRLTCIEMNCGQSSGLFNPKQFWTSFLKVFADAHR